MLTATCQTDLSKLAPSMNTESPSAAPPTTWGHHQGVLNDRLRNVGRRQPNHHLSTTPHRKYEGAHHVVESLHAPVALPSDLLSASYPHSSGLVIPKMTLFRRSLLLLVHRFDRQAMFV